VFSPDRNYRYLLTRQIDPLLYMARGGRTSTVAFCMLNPSTADEVQNDPTVARCVSFARAWGYGALVVLNLFAWRATDPAELYQRRILDWDIIGPDNDAYIESYAAESDLFVCAWGTHGKLDNRGQEVASRLRRMDVRLHHLGLNADGSPKHPLYLKGTLRAQPWIPTGPQPGKG
jgi:hypothetical protein